MELLSKKDYDNFGRYANDIVKRAQKKQLSITEPSESEIRSIMNIVLQFVKVRRRKIYGGFALNLLIVAKDPASAIYDAEDIPDIDFYSPDPLTDVVEICNAIYAAGFRHVMGREAIHKDTYSIRVNGQLYCDISYMPSAIYNRMPFRETAGFYVTGPEFMMIDYYRMMTDILSYWRLEKAVKRFYLLQKFYPLPHIKNPIQYDVKPDVAPYLDAIYKYVQNNGDVVVTGFYAYNYYLKESGCRNYKYLNAPYYEIISTNYQKNATELVRLLKMTGADIGANAERVHVVEHYPFFMFWGYFAYIYYGDTLVAKIFSNNKRCVPYIVAKAAKFSGRTVAESASTINIATFPTVIMYALITILKARVDENQESKNLYYTMISHLIDIRAFYFAKSGKGVYDTTPFQEFTAECAGVPVTPERERQLTIDFRKRRDKQYVFPYERKYIFSYDPSDGIVNTVEYMFANTSGNQIRNVKNLKLNTVSGQYIDVDIEQDQDPEYDQDS